MSHNADIPVVNVTIITAVKYMPLKRFFGFQAFSTVKQNKRFLARL